MSNGKVFKDIADRYDRLNAMLSLGQDQKWRDTVVSQLPSGRLLDLGGGTGAANEIFGDREVVALDPAPEMLALAPKQALLKTLLVLLLRLSLHILHAHRG